MSFGAHAETAALSVAQSDAILADAESYGWSVRETRAAVNRLKTEARLPANVAPIAGRKVFDFEALIRASPTKTSTTRAKSVTLKWRSQD
ncbi:MAG: hypothetical protein AB7P20_11470 [Rhizobiaceae bacterium]